MHSGSGSSQKQPRKESQVLLTPTGPIEVDEDDLAEILEGANPGTTSDVIMDGSDLDIINDSDSELWMGEVIPGDGDEPVSNVKEEPSGEEAGEPGGPPSSTGLVALEEFSVCIERGFHWESSL